MQTHEFTERFNLAGKTIVRAEISAPGFLGFVGEVEAARIAATSDRSFAACHLGERLKRRVVLVAEDGEKVALDDLGVMSLPVRVGVLLSRLVDETDEPAPEPGASNPFAAAAPAGPSVLGRGDGISSPILFRLGKPAAITRNGALEEITEIEFHAANFGALESVVAADGDLARTVALIRRCARPPDMVAAPAWFAEKISIGDGLTIMHDVLPRFFD